MKRICKECGQEFELAQSEINFYNSKNLALPKRCKMCRDKNRTGAASDSSSVRPEPADTVQAEGQSTSQNSYINLRGTKNKFITAAVLFICIIATLSGRQFLDIGSGNNNGNNNTSYESDNDKSSNNNSSYQFRNDKYLTEHFEKHGSDFDYSTKEEYLAGANKVIFSSNALHKTEKEDGDDVYYLKETNEFVIVSTDGYIRTYFKPANGIDYYNRQ